MFVGWEDRGLGNSSCCCCGGSNNDLCVGSLIVAAALVDGLSGDGNRRLLKSEVNRLLRRGDTGRVCVSSCGSANAKPAVAAATTVPVPTSYIGQSD